MGILAIKTYFLGTFWAVVRTLKITNFRPVFQFAKSLKFHFCNSLEMFSGERFCILNSVDTIFRTRSLVCNKNQLKLPQDAKMRTLSVFVAPPVWKRVEKRDRTTLQNFVKKHTVDSYRTIVNTDAWRAYRGLNAVRDHRVVNHSTKGKYRFVTKEGIHTNNAESCHSSVKRGI